MSANGTALAVRLPAAGMEVCRLYAAVSVLFLISGEGPLPFLPAGVILLAAMFLSLLLGRLKRRRITGLLIHGAGFGIAAAFLLTSFGSLPFAGTRTPAEFMRALSIIDGAASWFTFWLVLLSTALLWFRGRGIGLKEADYAASVGRFDVGIILLAGVFFLRMGLQKSDSYAVPLIAVYLLFGIFTLFAADSRRQDRQFLNRRSVSGLLFLFSAGFLLSGGVLVLLHPLLTRTALEAFSLLKEGSAPLKPWLIALLRFLLGFGFAQPAAGTAGGPSASSLPSGPPAEPGFWTRLIEMVLVYGLIALLALVSLGLGLYGLWRLLNYLAAREAPGSGEPSLRALLSRLLARVSALLRKLPGTFTSRLAALRDRTGRVRPEGASGFRKLCRWGRLSGMPRSRGETAAEYGRRLGNRFPCLENAVGTVVTMAESEVFGCRKLTPESRARLRQARRRFRDPRLIPARIACRLGLRRGANNTEQRRIPG
jgi:Domain of unknown function (DUF4129)